MSVIICGLAPGTVKKYRCPFCDYESDDIDNFATAMCWNCVYAEEPENPDNEDDR